MGGEHRERRLGPLPCSATATVALYESLQHSITTGIDQPSWLSFQTVTLSVLAALPHSVLCCAVQMYTGARPYGNMKQQALVEEVVMRGLRPRFPSHTPPSYVLLAQACWSGSAQARPTFEEVRGRGGLGPGVMKTSRRSPDFAMHGCIDCILQCTDVAAW